MEARSEDDLPPPPKKSRTEPKSDKNEMDQYFAETSLLDAFQGKDCDFYCIALKRSTKGEIRVLVRDKFHVTSALRFSPEIVEQWETILLPAVINVSEFTAVLNGKEPTLYITNFAVVKTKANLENYVASLQHPACINVTNKTHFRRVSSYNGPNRQAEIFDLQEKEQGAELIVQVSNIKSQATRDGNPYIKFDAMDATGKIQCIAWKEAQQHFRKIREGVSLKLVRPEITTAKPEWNDGYTTPYQLTITATTTVTECDSSFKIDTI